ncbi:MAG: flagellin, partial [Planctomycetota bacterium]|nr:flagellin [Planctomycetota bacterium]
MSMVIAHNIAAINTKRNFGVSSRGMNGAMERLSSGYKINTGKDDPSGLVISEQLRSQLFGLKRAQQNTEEAINVMGIAEGALNEMNAILKKMKALAIHSANNGITSPEQVAADQAEMDSSIQTLDRIAQTTKFSDQNLLNGGKEISYTQDTLTKGTQQNALVNARESDFSQIFKRDGYSVAINFTGTSAADMTTGTGPVDFSQQAMKAYFEIDTALDVQPKPQVDVHGAFTQDQQFTLTGTKGSRSFKFKKGASVSALVSQIKSAADSTGVGAALVFNSSQRIDKASQGGTAITVDQYINITGMPPKATTQPVSLIISGSISGNNTDFDSASVNFTIFASVVASGDPNAGSPMYTIIEGRTGKSTTLTLTASGAVIPGTFQSGALAGVTVKGMRNLDLSQQLDFVDPITTSGTLTDGTLGDVNLDGLNASAKKLLVGASDISASTVLICTNSGTGEGTLRVTINGVDTEGKPFSLVTEQKFIAPNLIQSGANAFTLAGGQLDGMEINLTTADSPLAVGTQAAGSFAIIPSYESAGTMSIGEGIVRKQNVDGNGNAASLGSVGGTQSGRDAVRQPGDAAVFNNTIANDGSGNVIAGVTSISFGMGEVQRVITQNSIQYGQNTDGQGRVFIKFTDDNSFELFKDAAMTEESKVATGVNGQPVRAVNNSGLEGIILNLTGENLVSKNGVYIALAGLEGYSATGANSEYKEGVAYGGSVVNKLTADANDPNPTYSGTAMFDASRTFITGVELGVNTADNATIYLKNVYDHNNGTVQVFAYKHADMRDEQMVAKSEIYSTRLEGGADAGSMTVVLNEVRNSDSTVGTGLGIVLSVDRAAFADQNKSLNLTGSMVFTNLAARIFAQDYGSSAFVKITQDKGAIFHEYATPGDNNSKRLVDAGTTGITVEARGQDATLSINGMQVKTDGLALNLATQDVQADLVFNGGKVGTTTLAQVGYDVGSIFTKIGVLNLRSAKPDSDIDSKYLGLSGLLCNAGHITDEVLGGFQNGMQLQLGEGAGDQNRTVVSIKDMTIDALGRVIKGGYWETGNPVWTEKLFTMKDVMGGGLACLKDNPIM